MENKIKNAVSKFFGDHNVVYATPGTDNHSSNFYGDSYICKLTQDDVAGCIETARDGWEFEGDATGGAIDAILSDLQYDKPE